ncbi:hypothetical protein Y032_0258g469 [Ancylostoma ceylanicum]|uniref:Reverse transcriptase domain-containing protein n=1 Tax=Ancylostoma ceylanicum TaxID=53326 RepID=A0A016SAV2_9BILA|nr:hypothetical protein Y032_0258g469 [Ancylostoma ceylanicum]
MAKATHYEKSNKELDTRDCERLIYCLAKSCRRQAKYEEKSREINDQHGKLLVDYRKDPAPWKLLHEDDVMIASLDKCELERLTQAWSDRLAQFGLCLNATKTEYLTNQST